MSVTGPDDRRGTEWDPVQALKNLTVEKAFESNETPAQQAKRLLSENLPVAVMSICHMATYSQIESIRFNAAKYVVDRTLGPSERVAASEGRNAWDDIYENVVTEAEDYLKKD